MAFGRLLTKWQILRSALEVPLAQCGIVFKACCHLHNFIIDKQIDCQEGIEIAYENGGTVLGYVPCDIDSAPSSGSILQQKLIQKIQSKSLSRLELNLRRRKFEDERRLMYISAQ